jgi:HD-like signal output (HDOD) protein
MGSFSSMLKNVEIPPLPTVAAQLIAELNKVEPDIEKLSKILSSAPEVSAKILQTVNSAFYGLKVKVNNVKHAVALLGINQIRAIGYVYAVKEALPLPSDDFFDQESFWIDSLLKAMLARSLATRFYPKEAENIFTAALLCDIALPVLLVCWGDYYKPVIEEWEWSRSRLSELEREHFGWDHSQAGAWMAKHWNFSEELTTLIGTHSMPISKCQEMQLQNTLAAPIVVSMLLPSILKPSLPRSLYMVKVAVEFFNIRYIDFMKIFREAAQGLEDVQHIFIKKPRDISPLVEDIQEAVREMSTLKGEIDE